MKQDAATPGIWNPLPYFDTVKADHQLGNIQSVSNYYQAAKHGTLPAVSWVVPSGAVSEHPPAPVSYGQSYVTSLVNAYDKFIEDDFLGGQRLDPRTDGRPDPRPDVRENIKILGNLVRDFDFNQAPRPAVLLPVHPKTTLTGTPSQIGPAGSK